MPLGPFSFGAVFPKQPAFERWRRGDVSVRCQDLLSLHTGHLLRAQPALKQNLTVPQLANKMI
jgi:hypothetical protein